LPLLIEFGHVKWAGLGVQVLPDHIAAQWGNPGRDRARRASELARAKAGPCARCRSISSATRAGFDVITRVQDQLFAQLVDLVDVLDASSPATR
jgi:hypothetical protein